jgi:hypothetical protein
MPSPPNITNIPAPRVPLIDERTGLMAREWYRFFFNLFNLTGGGSNAISLQDLQVGPPTGSEEQVVLGRQLDGVLAAPDGSTQESQIAEIQKQINGALAAPDGSTQESHIAELQKQVGALALEPPFAGEPPGWLILPRGVVVGASPFTFQNTTGRPVDLIVTGGVVSAIDFSRDNITFYSVGQTAGVFWLSPYDYLQVTYTAAPTITLVPR